MAARDWGLDDEGGEFRRHRVGPAGGDGLVEAVSSEGCQAW